MMERRLGLYAKHLLPTPLLDLKSREGVQDKSPVIIGAMVLDIQAIPFSKTLKSGTTAPGQIRYMKGGVARNVAECMTKLGTNPFLISVVGLDMAGDMLLAHWKSLGLSAEGIRRSTSVTTPVVSAIFDDQGELAAAVADCVTVEEQLTPEWIGQFGSLIRSASVLMLDANLNTAALEASCKLANMANVPIWFEPVSVAKSVRIKSISQFVTFASPNELELVAMSNSLHSATENTLAVSGLLDGSSDMTVEMLVQQLRPYISTLLDRGIEHIALTLGKHGVVLCSAELPKCSSIDQVMISSVPMNLASRIPLCEERNLRVEVQGNSKTSGFPSSISFPALPASVVSLSGAGDCFVAGSLTGLCRKMNICHSMAYGVAAAKQAVESAFNVPLQMHQDVIEGDAKIVLVAAKRISNS